MESLLDADPADALAPLDEVMTLAGPEAGFSPAWTTSAGDEEHAELPAPGGLPSLLPELFDWVTGSDLDDEDPAGGEGSLVDTGPLGGALETWEQAKLLTEVSPGALPGLTEVAEVPWLDGVSTGLGAAETFLNYQPSTTGEAAWAERAAVTAVDVAWGETPLGALDGATGGNVGGLFKGGTEALFAIGDAIASGDLDAMERASEHMRSGEHGVLAEGIGEVGNFMGEAAAESTLGLIELFTGEKQARPPEEKGRAPVTPREVQKTAEILAGSGGHGTVTWIDDPLGEEEEEDD